MQESYGIRLIIQRCIPELSHSVPFIDHVVNMRSTNATSNATISVDVDMNETYVEGAKWMS